MYRIYAEAVGPGLIHCYAPLSLSLKFSRSLYLSHSYLSLFGYVTLLMYVSLSVGLSVFLSVCRSLSIALSISPLSPAASPPVLLAYCLHTLPAWHINVELRFNESS